MEGAPLTPAENPDSGRFDSATDKSSDKKKKKSSADAAPRRSEGAESTTGERRAAARDTLANLSLSEAFGHHVEEKPKKKQVEAATENTEPPVEAIDQTPQAAEQPGESEHDVNKPLEAASGEQDAAVVDLTEQDNAVSVSEVEPSSPAIEQAYHDVLEQYAQQAEARPQATDADQDHEPISSQNSEHFTNESIEQPTDQALPEVVISGEQISESENTAADIAPEVPELEPHAQSELQDSASATSIPSAGPRLDAPGGRPTAPVAGRDAAPLAAPSSGYDAVIPTPTVAPVLPPELRYAAAPHAETTGSASEYTDPVSAPPHRAPVAPMPKIERRTVEKNGGLGTALALASLYGHFKLKKQNRILEQKLTKTNEAVTELQKDQLRTVDEVERLKQTTTIRAELTPATSSEIASTPPFNPVQASEAVKINPNSAPRFEQQAPLSVGGEYKNTQADQTKNKLSNPAEQFRAAPSSFAPERKNFAPERLDKREQLSVSPEKPSAPLVVEDEPVLVADDRRVETSSWHRIEIDKKTGKAVEDPTIAYGEAFQQERHQELRAQAADTSQTDGADQNTDGVVSMQAASMSSVAASNITSPTSASAVQTSSQQTVGPANPIEQTKRINDAKKIDNASIGLWAVFVTLVAATVFVFFS